MGSLRNPVGPLPSSIYWRRRAVMLSVVAVSALLIAWIVTAGGGGGGRKGSSASGGKNPTNTITPGPSGSGPAYSQHPGGRDESGGSDAGSGSGGSAGSAGAGSDDGAGGGNGGSGSGGGAGSGGSGSGGGAVVAGDALPGSSDLANCSSGAVSLGLRSLRNSYSPDQTPAFELTAKNTSSADCKVDLGPKNAVLTITPADGDNTFWSSADCPDGAGSLSFRVPAGKTITYTVKWDRRPSAAHCATPSGGAAKSGTYLLEAKTPGYGKLQASFVLSAD
ncbi:MULTISPECIES: hypothetical protein [unclassified Streptomyces]|uniref:hypothetical protein n=1 Tax=unclassified Streptomyces TaxID=2593676 RepID=UPI001890D6B1|nr:hypothetical protein [Streptomyces sp. SUK 48]